MDDLVKLRLQEQLLLQELELVRSKIHYVGLCQETELKKVTSQPSVAETCQKSEASPEQTATGKDGTNPLQAVALPKSKTEVQTSTTLVKPSDLNLRPNGGIQIPHKPESQFSAKLKQFTGVKSYYVVYDGPNPGIYTSWEVAEKAVKGFSGIQHKKFKTFEEARISANIYTTSQFKAPLELICSSEGLRPSYKGALTKGQSSKTTIGTIPKSQQKKLLEDDMNQHRETSYSEFCYLYRLGREAIEKTFVEHHYFTTDKKNISYFNFYPNSQPVFVLEAFLYGLIAMVYPSNNLLELSEFPSSFKDAVKTYRKKCLKSQEKPIYLKFTCTNVFWDKDDEPIQSYSYVQIGIIKEKIYTPSQAMNATVEKEDLFDLAVQKLIVLINKVFCINRDDKIKVNLATKNCLVTSFTHKELSEEDFAKIQAFRRQLVHPYVFGSHYPSLCIKVRKELEKHGIINLCNKCCPQKSSVENNEDPSTKGKEKVSAEKDSSSSTDSEQAADSKK